MDKIKVLWMNNGEDDVYSVIPDAIEYGIEIETCTNFTTCRRLLSSDNERKVQYDAVLVNASCQMLSERPKIDNLSIALDWMKRVCPRIPWFVINSETSLDRRDKGNLTKTLKPYSGSLYSIQESKLKLELFDGIHEKTYFLPHRRFAKELGICREQERDSLLNLLWKLHKRDNEIEKDHTIPTDCRKVLEGIRNSARSGIIHIPSISKPENELNMFSKQIDASGSIIPEYVKRSFHRCCTVSQDGSHTLETDRLIKEGKAPYLTKSLIFDLLNILNWLYDVNKTSFQL